MGLEPPPAARCLVVLPASAVVAKRATNQLREAILATVAGSSPRHGARTGTDGRSDVAVLARDLRPLQLSPDEWNRCSNHKADHRRDTDPPIRESQRPPN